jgi:hypothetical protein
MKRSEGACLYCGFTFSAISGLDDESETREPKEGDFTVCGDCGGGMIFTADGSRRKPTPEEAERVDADPRVQIVRLGIAAFNLLEPHLRGSLNARNN